jgi:hypothetical protein
MEAEAAATTTAAAAGETKRTPSEFLKQVLGRPVVVKLNSGVDYRGARRRGPQHPCLPATGRAACTHPLPFHPSPGGAEPSLVQASWRI